MRARGAQAGCAGPACAPRRGTIRAHPGASGRTPLPMGGGAPDSFPPLQPPAQRATRRVSLGASAPRAVRGHGNPGVRVETPRGRAGGPAAPGQTPRMPVGFRPKFPGVSALRPKRAGRAHGGVLGGRWGARARGWGEEGFGAGERPGRKQQGPGTHPAPSPARDPVWTAVASADPRARPLLLAARGGDGEAPRALPDPRAGKAGRNHPRPPLFRAAGLQGICKPCLN